MTIGKHSYYELNGIKLECGQNAHYACGRCEKCYQCNHRSWYSGTSKAWYWQCENKTVGKSGSDKTFLT